MQYSRMKCSARTALYEHIQPVEIILDRRVSMSAIFNNPLRFLAFSRYNRANKLKRGLVYDYWYP